MPVRLILLSLMLLGASTSFAQRFYFKAHGGYGLPTGGRYETLENIRLDFSSGVADTIFSADIFRVSLGPGPRIGVNFGYLFSEYVGIDVGFHYFTSNTIEGSQTQYSIARVRQLQGHMIRLVPSVVLTAWKDKKFTPHATLGVALGFAPKVTETINFGNISLPFLTDVYEYGGRMAFGYNATFGVTYNATKAIGIFAELNLVSMAYGASEGELVESNYRDISTLTTAETMIEFVDEFQVTSSTTVDPTQPTQQIREAYPFSTFGLNVGIKISVK